MPTTAQGPGGKATITRWPWLTAVLALVVIFNPYGLAIIGAAIEQSATDWFAGLWLAVTLIGTCLLVVLAVIEWRVRIFINRRRSGV